MPGAVAICLGLMLGWATGGSPRSLIDSEIRFSLPLILLFSLQALLRNRYRTGALDSEMQIVGWAGCVLLLIAICVFNYRVRGMVVIAIGLGMNAMVVILNAGMPVVTGAVSAASLPPFYHLADPRDSLLLLGDVMPARLFMLSLGDLLLVVGLIILVASAMGTSTVHNKESG